MDQNGGRNYFQIGSFVIAGVILLVAAILILGSGMLFKKVIYVETYFNESVQGLSEGSPVKYLGMKIGEVKQIAAIDSIYKIDDEIYDKTHNRYIYVKMAITPKFFVGKNGKNLPKDIKYDVSKGLRVKLALQGLTGNAYLELDFLDPTTHPLLPIYWQPKNYYIPSTTSTLAYFSENVQYLLTQLREINFKKLLKDIQRLVDQGSRIASKSNALLTNINRQLIDTVDNIRNISGNLSSLAEQARAYPPSMFFSEKPKKLEFGKQ